MVEPAVAPAASRQRKDTPPPGVAITETWREPAAAFSRIITPAAESGLQRVDVALPEDAGGHLGVAADGLMNEAESVGAAGDRGAAAEHLEHVALIDGVAAAKAGGADVAALPGGRKGAPDAAVEDGVAYGMETLRDAPI